MKHKILIFLLALSCNLFAQGPVTQLKVPGIPIVHSPKSTGKYLGSPSIVTLPNGDYLMSFDFFGPSCKTDIVQVYKSTDKGLTWNFLAELEDTFWAGLFTLRN